MPLPPGMRPVSNPPNPWLSTDVEYLEEPPIARLEVIEDGTKSILAHNDSPDLGFRWSLNPYRGCYHACAYCLDGDTRILRADGRHVPLRDLEPGDDIYGTEVRGGLRRYVKTSVLDVWQTVKRAYRVELDDGSIIVASGDHRFLTDRGWKHVVQAERGSPSRPFLKPADRMMGTGAFAEQPVEAPGYMLGYLAGISRTDDGTLVDLEPLRRMRTFLSALDGRAGVQTAAGAEGARLGRDETISRAVRPPDAPDEDWCKGLLAGLFDAEGTSAPGVLRMANVDPEVLRRAKDALGQLGFDVVFEGVSARGEATSLAVSADLREKLRFLHLVDPSARRKRDLAGTRLTKRTVRRVLRITPLGVDLPMYDITTGTGDFIANGMVSHNCYARPRHEYLSLGAGTDFERKLIVKPNAPSLLREAFDRQSWRGELVLLSGDTDCYQPLEASYRLTRGCLEVMLEYKNPCGVITKSPLIERDVDLLAELSRAVDLGVTISIPFWNPDHARAMEPFVATPQRRLKTIERLARAGVRVGVNVAPLVPGLGDEDMPTILEAARDAGAVRAGSVFLRLPGPVAVVFEDRLRKSLPLRAERVLARVRGARGGNLYDGRFGARQRGQGPYAEAALALFEATARRLGLETSMGPAQPRRDTFERPARAARAGARGAQLDLFGGEERPRRR